MPTARELRIITNAARRYGLRPATLYGVWGAESNFGQNRNDSSAGAQGPFQFMPATARSYGIDPHNFRQAANAAAKYLSTYQDRGFAGMLAAYNAGPAGNPNNAETQAYIPRVRQLARQFPGASGGGGGGAGGGGGGPAQQMLQAPPGPSGASSLPGGSGSTLALLQALQGGARASGPASGGLAAPAHSAAPVMPQGLQAAVSGGGPAARPDTAALMAAVRTMGEGMPDVAAAVGGNPQAALRVGMPDQAPAGAKNRAVANIMRAAETIEDARVPYQWGGGHAGRQKRFGPVTPLDCSGAVSRVLGINPLVSGQFASWGKAGEGKRVTIYANSEHVLMKVDGRFFGTSSANPGGGAGWIPAKHISREYLSRFKVRHPPGM